jgi:hypothetical protein
MLFTPYALTDAVFRSVSESDDGLMVTFSGISTGGRGFSITTRLDDANRWVNGELIQIAMPYLSADQREILKTGIDSESWSEMFAGSEEEEA